MRTSRQKQQGVSTLIMILAVGAAMAASLYGAYSHMGATGKSQDTSSARTEARALAQDALDASAEHFNQLYCGSANGTCANGNAANVDATAIPNGTLLVNQALGSNSMSASVVTNNFTTSGVIEVDAIGQTPTGSANVRAYLQAATIYTFTPLPSSIANLFKGSQNLLGNVTINTGVAHSLTVVGNLSIGGSAAVVGTANATGTITGCDSTTATCTSNVATSSVVSPTVDAYNLSSEANAVFSVNASGAAEVTFQNDAGLVPAGTTLLSNFPLTSTSLCLSGGSSCISGPGDGTPLHSGTWVITGTEVGCPGPACQAPTPGVLFFYGDVDVGSGMIGIPGTTPAPGYATIIATGNVAVATNNDIVAYGQMPDVCNQTNIPVNVCPNGQTTANNGEGSGQVANAVLISGGYVNYPYVGGSTVYYNGTTLGGVPPIGDTTESDASSATQPSGTVTGYFCASNGNSIGAAGICPSGSTTTSIITGGEVTLSGNSDLTGALAAGESLTAKGTGTITGIVETADTNGVASSALGASNNDIKGNLTINYAPGVPGSTNFGGGGTTGELAFVPLWQRYVY